MFALFLKKVIIMKNLLIIWYSFMTRDVGYKFYIHNKKDIITQGIIDAKCESSFNRKEKHIMNELNELMIYLLDS